jgi:hypothetical protein
MGDDASSRLRALGLLAENHTFGEVTGEPRKKFYPWCLINWCPEYRRSKTRHRDVDRNAFECPYCGYALVWKTKQAKVLK